MLLTSLTVLSALHLVAGRGLNFVADPLTKGDLAVWCIYDVIYLVLCVLCIIPIIKLTHRRLPFVTLFLAMLFTVIQGAADIAFILINNNFSTFPSIRTVAALNDVFAFFGDWSSPLLFLAIVLVLEDRHAHIRQTAEGGVGKLNKIFPIVHYTLFGLIMIMATVAAGLLATYNTDIVNLDSVDFITEAAIVKLNRDFNRQQTANYVFISFWFATAVYITALAGFVFKVMARANISDKITKLTFFFTVPFYSLGMLTSIIFTILFSPVGITRNGTVHTIESADIANDILLNFFFAGASLGVLLAGLKREHWGATPRSSLLVNLRPFKPGQYQELEDPPLRK